jgi:HD superfamily phosphodiesterase
LNVGIVKDIVTLAKYKFGDEFPRYIKPMSDYALKIAQEVGADPLICMISSLLHRWAEGTTGDFRANKVNSILREFGFDAKTIDHINDIINHLLPETHTKQTTPEEKVVGDAYILAYWKRFVDYENVHFNFETAEKIFHAIEE